MYREKADGDDDVGIRCNMYCLESASVEHSLDLGRLREQLKNLPRSEFLRNTNLDFDNFCEQVQTYYQQFSQNIGITKEKLGLAMKNENFSKTRESNPIKREMFDHLFSFFDEVTKLSINFQKLIRLNDPLNQIRQGDLESIRSRASLLNTNPNLKNNMLLTVPEAPPSDSVQSESLNALQPDNLTQKSKPFAVSEYTFYKEQQDNSLDHEPSCHKDDLYPEQGKPQANNVYPSQAAQRENVSESTESAQTPVAHIYNRLRQEPLLPKILEQNITIEVATSSQRVIDGNNEAPQRQSDTETKSELLKIIQGKEATIAALSEQLKSATTETQSIQARIDELSFQHQELQNEYKNLSELKQNVQLALTNATEQVTGLMNQNKNLKSDIRRLNSQLKNEKASLFDLQVKMDSLNQTLAALQQRQAEYNECVFHQLKIDLSLSNDELL